MLGILQLWEELFNEELETRIYVNAVACKGTLQRAWTGSVKHHSIKQLWVQAVLEEHPPITVQKISMAQLCWCTHFTLCLVYKTEDSWSPCGTTLRTCTRLEGSSMQVTQPHGATRNPLWLLVEVECVGIASQVWVLAEMFNVC